MSKEIGVGNSVKGMGSKGFGCNVSNVQFRAYMAKPDKSSSNGFTHTHDRAGKMLFLDLG